MQSNNIINLEEYNELIEIRTKYSTILEAIFKNAELNYGEYGLNFDCDDICTIVKYLEPGQYEKKLIELKEDKKTEENNG